MPETKFYRTRICKEERINWYGFVLKRGMIFGTSYGEDYATTGELRPAKRADGTVYGTKIKVWFHDHIEYWRTNQVCRSEDWSCRWISTGSDLGKQLAAKAQQARNKGIKVQRYEEFPCTSENKHLFTSSRANRHGHKLRAWEEAAQPKGYTWAECDKASPVRG